jgi:hypothetical protein
MAALLFKNSLWVPIEGQMERGHHRNFAFRHVLVEIETMEMNYIDMAATECALDRLPMLLLGRRPIPVRDARRNGAGRDQLTRNSRAFGRHNYRLMTGLYHSAF